MRQPGDPEIAGRVRAARGYARLEQAALAQTIGVGLATYKRMEAAERPVSKPERAMIAKACGVPLQFMEDGFDALIIASDDVLARRVLDELRAQRALLESLHAFVHGLVGPFTAVARAAAAFGDSTVAR